MTAGLLGWLVHQFGVAQLVDALRKADSAGVVGMFALSIAMVLTVALRWHLLLRPLDGPAIRFREVSEATFIGYSAGYFLPSVGGDAVRVSCLVKPGRGAATLALSALVDRCMGLLALLALGVLAVCLHGAPGERSALVWSVYVGATIIVALALVLCGGTGRAARWLERFAAAPAGRLASMLRAAGEAMEVYAARKTLLLQALALSIVSQLLSVSIYYGIARTVGAGSRLLDFFYAVPVVNLAMVMPISIGGIGVGEWTFVYIFTDLGMSRDAAFSVSLLNLLARLAAGLVGAACCALARQP